MKACADAAKARLTTHSAQPTDGRAMASDDLIGQTILKAVAARGAGKTICPSEVARTLAQDWRALMPDIRRVAQRLQDQGQITATQRGHPVDAETARGPIRLGLPPKQRTLR